MTHRKRKLFLVFNHRLTPEQVADARVSLDVNDFVPLPQDLQQDWSDVPPDLSDITDHIAPVCSWLERQARPGDAVLVHGDFGACHLVVGRVIKQGLIPVYSTTRRETEEKPQPDGSIRVERVFRHSRFRQYKG